jgi:hypothetical protein
VSDGAVDIEGLKDHLDRDGYVVLPGLFKPEEIDRLRMAVTSYFRDRGVIFQMGKTQPNAAIECPDISWLFPDSRVVTTFQAAYGARNVFFTGHCDIHQNAFSAWHKDTGPANSYFDEDCFVNDCRVYKMAIYLQDHHDGLGMTLVPGSQRNAPWGRDEAVGVPLRSKAGDAVVFDVRMDHRGRRPNAAERLLHFSSRVIKRVLGPVFPALKKPGDVKLMYSLARAWAHLTGQPTRMSVFFTFGGPDRFARQFARNNMNRQLSQYVGGGKGGYPPGLVEKLQAQGVEVYMGEAAPPPSAAA